MTHKITGLRSVSKATHEKGRSLDKPFVNTQESIKLKVSRSVDTATTY